MAWLLAATILVLIGMLLRWALRLDSSPVRRTNRLAHLGTEREQIYRPVGLEIETQSAILGVSLNDAFEERDAGQAGMAWRLVQLSLAEWDRLAEILAALNSLMAQRLDDTRVVIPSQPLVAGRFKSPSVIGFARMHELFDQLVFHSKLRFQLHLRLLRRASEILTAEVRRDCGQASRIDHQPPELWQHLDNHFHDFDLVAKETLLSFRTLLSCLPHSSLAELARDLEGVMHQSVRTNTWE
jgi:hypothetical protein